MIYLILLFLRSAKKSGRHMFVWKLMFENTFFVGNILLEKHASRGLGKVCKHCFFVHRNIFRSPTLQTNYDLVKDIAPTAQSVV